MTDTSDDWMHPRSVSYQTPPPKEGTYYVIQRKKAHFVFGPSGMMHTWERWQEFRSKEERDKELVELRDRHPMWRLRARTLTYLNGQQISGAPFEHMDDHDD